MTYIMEPLCESRLYWCERTDEMIHIRRGHALGGWVIEALCPWSDEPDSNWYWVVVDVAPTMTQALNAYRHLNPNILLEEFA